MTDEILDIPEGDSYSPPQSSVPPPIDIRPFAKPITRSGGGEEEESEILDLGSISSIEPCALPFVFPDNMEDMTWEEKEELHKKFLRHGLTDTRKSLVENNPSELVYPGSPEYQRQMDERKRAIAGLRKDEPFEVSRFEFDKEKGYLVEETPDTLAEALARSNLEADEIEKLTAPKATYREVSEKEIEERLRLNIKNDKGIH